MLAGLPDTAHTHVRTYRNTKHSRLLVIKIKPVSECIGKGCACVCLFDHIYLCVCQSVQFSTSSLTLFSPLKQRISPISTPTSTSAFPHMFIRLVRYLPRPPTPYPAAPRPAQSGSVTHAEKILSGGAAVLEGDMRGWFSVSVFTHKIKAWTRSSPSV